MEGIKQCTNKVDIYSFGVTLLEFILCRHPFSNADGGFNLLRAVKGLPLDAAERHPHPCAKLALKMIVLDPTARPSIAEIVATDVFAMYGDFLSGAAVLLKENEKLLFENVELKKRLKYIYFQAELSPRDIPFTFLPNPANKSDVVVSGNTLSVKRECHLGFIVSKEVNSGIFKLIYESEGDGKGYYPTFGICHSSIIALMTTYSGPLSNSSAIDCGGITCGPKTELHKDLFSRRGKHTVGIELELPQPEGPALLGVGVGVGVMHFFVDGKQIPYVVDKIPPAVHFVFIAWKALRVNVLSFQQLPAPTTNPTLQCTEFEWK